MMHFTEDKHWFEWNRSCVVVPCPAVMAVYQTVFQLPVSVFKGDYSSYPDKRGKLHSTVCLVQCLLNVQRIALHIQGKTVLTSLRRNLYWVVVVKMLNISLKQLGAFCRLNVFSCFSNAYYSKLFLLDFILCPYSSWLQRPEQAPPLLRCEAGCVSVNLTALKDIHSQLDPGPQSSRSLLVHFQRF